MRKASLTAQLIADKLLREDPFNLVVLLGRPNTEKLIDFVLVLADKVRHDLDKTHTRGLAAQSYDPKLKRKRKLTDEELDNA